MSSNSPEPSTYEAASWDGSYPEPFSEAEQAEITQAANELSADGDKTAIIDMLQRIEGSGVELMMVLRDQYREGDPTPLYLAGMLLEQVARQAEANNG